MLCWPNGPAQAGSAGRRPAVTRPLLASSFFKNEFAMDGATVTEEHRADAMASAHTVCALELVLLSRVLLSDTRRTDSDRTWSRHWLRRNPGLKSSRINGLCS